MLANLDHLCSEVVVGCADTYPIDLYVPLCVDLESGAGGEARATPLQQFEVMEWLSNASLLGRIPGFDGVVLPMVGFDPRRDCDLARSSFRAVQDRVRRGAAIGVKLYPPMGFRPLGNERAVDARLHELYEWCVDERVPIVAHCSPANAVRGADDAAHPHGWRPVLERYPTLHLGLAHAGGIDKSGWSSAALDLVRDFLHDGHVYADVSNHDHIGRGRQFLEEVAAKACHTGWGFTGRLMFGTDFWFLYMHRDIEHFLSDYASRHRRSARHARHPRAGPGRRGTGVPRVPRSAPPEPHPRRAARRTAAAGVGRGGPGSDEPDPSADGAV